MRLNGPATRRSAIVWLAALLMAALTARLGLWQLDRAAQKNNLQAAMQEQRGRPPLDAVGLARDAGSALLQQHRAVSLEGQWLAQHTLYLDNRQMNARVGFFALTPLQLDDGTSVLVQRGWLPRDQVDRSRIVATPVPTGRVQVHGRIALEPSRLYEFEGAASGPIRQNVGLQSLARESGLPLRPVTVVQEDAPGSASLPVLADGLLRQWPAPSLGVHKHYGYAFQWFSLSVLTMSLTAWFQVIRPWRAAKATRRAGGSAESGSHQAGAAAR